MAKRDIYTKPLEDLTDDEVIDLLTDGAALADSIELYDEFRIAALAHRRGAPVANETELLKWVRGKANG
jgi:hypothetical protein